MTRCKLRCALAMAMASVAGASSAHADFDRVSIGVSLDFPSGTGPDGSQYYRLRGQSVYFSQRTSSGTTGGQLDGVTSFDSANSVFEIAFIEVFPEPNLTDYLRFGYFGVIETVAVDDLGDETVVDTSFVIAGQGLSSSTRVEDLFPTLTEASLVAALTTQFDSPEFFTALAGAEGNSALSGVIGLGISGVGQIRQGDSLTLYAFVPSDSDPNGLSARDVGFLETSILRVPTPSAAALLGVAGLMAARRRR